MPHEQTDQAAIDMAEFTFEQLCLDTKLVRKVDLENIGKTLLRQAALLLIMEARNAERKS